MKTKIVVIGCSFSSWKRQKTWSEHVREKYGELQFVNLGETGTSNEYLLPKIIKYANEDVDSTIYLIQLTGLDRVCINGEVSPTPTSLNKKTIFNAWGMFNDDRKTDFWINYFKNHYNPEMHYKKLLGLLLEFQSIMKTKKNSDYCIFSGWDTFTSTGDSHQFDAVEKYTNINHSLLKDKNEEAKKLFECIDFNKFWFFNNEFIKYGGITQYVQYTLPNEHWYRNIKINPPDLHPSDLAHKTFAENIVYNLVDKML